MPLPKNWMNVVDSTNRKGRMNGVPTPYKPIECLLESKGKNMKRRGGRPTWGCFGELEHEQLFLSSSSLYPPPSSLPARIPVTIVGEPYLYSPK